MHRMTANQLVSDTLKLDAFLIENVNNADILDLCLRIFLRKIKRNIFDKLRKD